MLTSSFLIVYSLLVLYYRDQLSRFQAFATFICLIAAIITSSSDMLIVLIGFEFLVITVIFIVASSSIRDAVIYGSVNFLSGVLIMYAIGYDISLDDNSGKILLFIGIVMHCGMFPLSRVVIDCYSKVGSIDATFLQIFSTKAALVVLYKIFQGEGALLYFSVASVIYSVIYSIREDNIRKLVVYNTIGQVGLISIGIYAGNNVMPYVISSIVYQSLLYVVVHEVGTHTGMASLYNLRDTQIKSPALFISFFAVILSMMGLPLTSSFFAKSIAIYGSSPYLKCIFIFGNSALVLTVALRMFYVFFLQGGKQLLFKLSYMKNLILALFIVLLFMPIYFNQYVECYISSYSSLHIIETIIYSALTVLVFYFVRNKIYGVRAPKYDFDCIYIDFLNYIFLLLRRFSSYLKKILSSMLGLEIRLLSKYQNVFQDEVVEVTALSAIVLICVFLLFKFVF